VVEIAASFFGAWIRRHTPRAALLSALAGVGITFIAMGFIFQIFSSPLIALFPQSLLAPIRKDLTFDPGNEAPASDPRWTRDMEARVTKTPVAVTAKVPAVFSANVVEDADVNAGTEVATVNVKDWVEVLALASVAVMAIE